MTKKSVPFITQRCRDLRRQQTPAEGLLWKELRNRKQGGFKFLRQQPFIFGAQRKVFYMDFYCAEVKLVIELDGGIHDDQQEYDAWREEIIRDEGCKILRFRNEELDDMRKVLECIRKELTNRKEGKVKD